jgi:hypothetical protein
LGGSGLVAIALLVLAYAAVSRRLLGSVITPAMVFVAGGIVARYAAWFTAHPRDAVPAFEAVPTPHQRPHRLAAGKPHADRKAEDASMPPGG